MPFIMNNTKSKKGHSVSEEFAYLTEVQLDRSDLPFIQYKDIQYSVRHLDILK